MVGRRLIGFFALLAPLAASAEALDNAAIVALSKAGLGAGPILAKVRQAPCGYDTSATALIALKQASVPESVIVAMIERCAAGGPAGASAPNGQAAGIYLADGPGPDARLTMLRPAARHWASSWERSSSGMRPTSSNPLTNSRIPAWVGSRPAEVWGA